MQTHTITLKARVFSDEEEELILLALNEFARSHGETEQGGQASDLHAELKAGAK